MGYVREKYTREYFLKQDKDGNRINIGAEGVDEFLTDASPRSHDKAILDRIDFKGKTVIDFGFGRGEAIKYMSEQKAKKIVGVDFSPSSVEIASRMLEHYGHRPDLNCEDALSFITSYKKQKNPPTFDIVIMFDFVEHIPREELRQLFTELKGMLSEKSIVAINTPVYRIDNDLIREGLKEEARDASDNWDQTKGMHCNRYTKKSLRKFMEDLGYFHITAKFFSPNFRSTLPGMRLRFQKAKKELFPLKGRFTKELFEKAQIEGEKKPIWRRIFSRSSISLVVPPAFFAAKRLIFREKQIPPSRHKPTWHKIKGGILRGKWFFGDNHFNAWQEIIEGTFDRFFFDYIRKFDLEDKVVFDVGAFVGSHSLAFAQLVGQKGKVYSFEPNRFNIERMRKIFARNKDLGKRILIMPFVLSNRNGKVKFNFSDQIDVGYSSAGYVEGADTPRQKGEYKTLDFKRVFVRSIKLDDLEKNAKVSGGPSLIKIDVEGAESEILSGGIKFLKKYRPIILAEIHSAQNMVRSLEVLFSLGYRISVLNQEKDGRAFLCAEPGVKNHNNA